MDVTRSDTPGGMVRIETDRLELQIDPATLRIDLSSDGTPDEGSGVQLLGFRPVALVGGRRLVASETLLDGWGELRTRSGMARRVELRARSEPPFELHLYVETADGWPGVVVELALHNAGENGVAVERLDALAWEENTGRLQLPGRPEDLRFYRMGYQSWSPAERLRLRGRDARGRPGALRRMHFAPGAPLPRRGLLVSDFVTELRAGDKAGLVLGFLSHNEFLTHATLRHARGRVRALHASVSTEGRALGARRTLRAERLWIGLPGPGEDGIAEWAERAGHEMQAPVPARNRSGWSSWYQFFTRVCARDVQRNLAALAPFRGRIDTVQIDDGFQRAVGDWLEFAPGFPDGLAGLAEEIRAAGFRAGLWLAPFLASRLSEIARAHPDWLLRGARGRPLVACINPGWKGGIAYALDPARPQALDWLEHVVRTVGEWGFDYLKLDFLYAALLGGRRPDDRASRVSAYRNAIERLRTAAGPDTFLVGCGAPLGPSIGLFDAMRVGPDVAPAWRNRWTDRLLGLAAAPAAENSVRNVLARAALHQRLWLNDPDCVLVRQSDTHLSPDEVRTLAAVVALSGGPVVVSDDLERVSPERAELLSRLLPSLGRTPHVTWGAGAVPEQLHTRFPDGSTLVLRVNLTRSARTLPIDARRLGLGGRVHLYDVWGERYCGLHPTQRPLELDPTPARGSLLVRLVPEDRRPAVLGSSLHVGAGALETARLRAAPDGTTRLELRLAGHRSGGILVLPGTGEPVPARLDFTDTAEIDLRSRAS